MPLAQVAHAEDWLFGTDRKQRARTRRTLVASLVYLLAAVGQWSSAQVGLADPLLAHGLILCLAPGVFGFFLLLRSGLTRGLADPALTLQQMVFAIVAMAYGIGAISGCHVNPAVSLGMFVAGRMSARQMVVHWIAQFLGALVGAGILAAIAGTAGGLGQNGWGPGYGGGFSMQAALI